MSDTTLSSAGPVDAKLIENLVAASRILAHHGVLDAWGHVSMRHPSNPQRCLMSRARAPAMVSIHDIMEFDLDSNPVDQRDRCCFLERFIHGCAYKARPDVNAVVHSHSPTVVPFGRPIKYIAEDETLDPQRLGDSWDVWKHGAMGG
jgi:ribulose-5-phosphate 4-epimerase/fuculose-1-phosphate aldolase